MTMAAIGAGISAAGTIGGSLLGRMGSTNVAQGPTNSRETGTVKTSGFSPEIMKVLEGVITSGQFSKDAANKDSTLAMQDAMQTVMMQYMPDIAAAGKGSGMMGDSMTQLLSRFTATQAATQGAKVRLDTVNNYNNDMVNLLNALAAGQARTETRDLTTKTDATSSTESKSPCWITSAICEELGLPDDCETLRVLRWYRDSYMLDPDYPERGALVAQYYATAPTYAPVLNALGKPERSTFFTRLNTMYLQPAVRNVVAGEYDAALSVYTHMFNEVQALVFSMAPELKPEEPKHAEYTAKADLAMLPPSPSLAIEGE